MQQEEKKKKSDSNHYDTNNKDLKSSLRHLYHSNCTTKKKNKKCKTKLTEVLDQEQSSNIDNDHFYMKKSNLTTFSLAPWLFSWFERFRLDYLLVRVAKFTKVYNTTSSMPTKSRIQCGNLVDGKKLFQLASICSTKITINDQQQPKFTHNINKPREGFTKSTSIDKSQYHSCNDHQRSFALDSIALLMESESFYQIGHDSLAKCHYISTKQPQFNQLEKKLDNLSNGSNSCSNQSKCFATLDSHANECSEDGDHTLSSVTWLPHYQPHISDISCTSGMQINYNQCRQIEIELSPKLNQQQQLLQKQQSTTSHHPFKTESFFCASFTGESSSNSPKLMNSKWNAVSDKFPTSQLYFLTKNEVSNKMYSVKFSSSQDTCFNDDTRVLKQSASAFACAPFTMSHYTKSPNRLNSCQIRFKKDTLQDHNCESSTSSDSLFQSHSSSLPSFVPKQTSQTSTIADHPLHYTIDNSNCHKSPNLNNKEQEEQGRQFVSTSSKFVKTTATRQVDYLSAVNNNGSGDHYLSHRTHSSRVSTETINAHSCLLPVNCSGRHRFTYDARVRKYQFLVNNFLERPHGRAILYHLSL